MVNNVNNQPAFGSRAGSTLLWETYKFIKNVAPNCATSKIERSLDRFVNSKVKIISPEPVNKLIGAIDKFIPAAQKGDFEDIDAAIRVQDVINHAVKSNSSFKEPVINLYKTYLNLLP